MEPARGHLGTTLWMNAKEGLLCSKYCKGGGGLDHKPARCRLWPPALTGWYRRQELSISALG